MRIDGNTLVVELIERYPYLLEFLPRISEKYERLKDDEMRKQMGAIATLDMVADMGGIPLGELMDAISREVKSRSEDDLEYDGEVGPDKEKIERLKGIIKDLHGGSTVEEVKHRFAGLIRGVSSTEIARMEQELIDEGMPSDEIKRLCDVHVEVFKDSLDTQEDILAPPGHPVNTFMKENRALEGLLAAFSALLKDIRGSSEVFRERYEDLSGMLDSIGKIENHYLRKENQLFPGLESKGVAGPSQVMWSQHDDIRSMIKELKGSEDLDFMVEKGEEMIRTMKDMVYKEEKVLYPMCMDKFDDSDWFKVKKGEEEIGFSWVDPGEGWDPGIEEDKGGTIGTIDLDEGHLTLKQLNNILKSLPLDISFVDKEEKVAYYSATDDRIFPRSPGVIGREVKNCHPPKSVHVVQKILDKFKAGNKDVAEFWIQLQGKFIHIRYFAVRDDKGEFLGTLEVSQDVTEIRKLEGQKRLLDWEG